MAIFLGSWFADLYSGHRIYRSGQFDQNYIDKHLNVLIIEDLFRYL